MAGPGRGRRLIPPTEAEADSEALEELWVVLGYFLQGLLLGPRGRGRGGGGGGGEEGGGEGGAAAHSHGD